MRTFKVLQTSVSTNSVIASHAGAMMVANEKKTKNTAAFAHSPFRTTAFVIMAVFFVFFSFADIASANEPWWHVMTAARPSYLQPGLAKDEVVSITPEATEGEFDLTNSGTQAVESFKWDATHEEVQTKLENILGPHNDLVTGGPTVIATGNVTLGSDEITGVTTSLGTLAEGQQVSLAHFNGGGRIEHIAPDPTEPGKLVLTLSGPAFGTQTGVELAVRARYVLTFTGELADQDYDFPGREVQAARGGEVVEVTRGRPDATITINAANVGTAAIAGGSVTQEIMDKLPAGLRATSIVGFDRLDDFGPSLNMFPCELKTLTCTFTETLNPGEQIEVLIGVIVEGARSTSESGESNEVTFSGGGAPTVHAAYPIAVSSAAIPYGFQDAEQTLEQEGGAPDTQAGSHPYQFTTALDFNQVPPSPRRSRSLPRNRCRSRRALPSSCPRA